MICWEYDDGGRANVGWRWVPLCGIGTAPPYVVDLAPRYAVRCITSQRRHYAAVVGQKVRDTWDSRRGRYDHEHAGLSRQVYGIWLP